VVADALDDRGAAELRTANRSPARPAQEQLAGGRPVQDGVAGDDVVLGDERRRSSGRTITRPPESPWRRSRWCRRSAAGWDAARQERAERLPAGAAQG
jgi:hypothetical protein